ncbi:MAG: hypothetical protein H7144_07670 [Burkholderiales bacterium]|nr:hypothetical protein [Phycisphaerae bacterium]
MSVTHSKAPAIMAAAVIGIVASIVGGVWWLRASPTTPAETIASTAPAAVLLDHDYYVFVRLVEFKPTKPNGARWDRGGDSGPDANAHISWRGNRIFKLPSRTDQLISTWDLFRVDIAKLITDGGKIDIESAINAPLVRVARGEAITIEVWDNDAMFSDVALNMSIPLADLREGRNDITPPASSGLARLQVILIDRQTPLPRRI